MIAILRAAKFVALATLLGPAAYASPLMDAALNASDWETAYLANVPPVELANPIQLACDCEPACGACDTASDRCTDCGDALCDCGSACDGCPVWYASAGMIFLKRDRPAPGTVVAANPAGTPFSSASDFSFDWEPGVDVVLARRFAGGTILEGRYFGVDSTDTNAFVTPGNFIGAGFTGPGGTSFNGKYLTMLDSTEINLRRAVSDRLSILGGFRWVELKDEMFYKLNGDVATGDYEYNNRLYGGQLGASFTPLRPAGRWIANVEGKAGLYGNVADGGIFEYQGNNFIGSFAGSDTTTAFVGEIGLSLGYRLNQHVVLRSGYQLLWLGDVALAGDAASRSLLNPSLLRTVNYADLFYQGATTGVDVAW